MANRCNLAKLHIAKKELGLTDEAYRDTLRNITGKDSAAKITDNQAGKVLIHFKNLGWKPRGQAMPSVSVPNDPQSKKIQALWINMNQAGIVRHGSNVAMLAFVKKVTGVDRLEWCNAAQKSTVIEVLKDWAQREGLEV